MEYIPYGEVFVEERNNSFSTNFLIKAKELDNETGLYYYGARYLDPTGAMWLSVDPMWEKYAGMSPYNYCMGNPVKMVDPDGRDVKNGHEAEIEEYSAKLEELKPSVDRNLTRESVDRKTWRSYKRDVKQYDDYNELYEQALVDYEKTKNRIEEYKNTDPEYFNKINNLSVTVEGGKSVPIDVYVFNGGYDVEIDGEIYDTKGGATIPPNIKNFVSAKKAVIRGEKSRLKVNIYVEGTRELAHEFGHTYQYSLDPTDYKKNNKTTKNCQNYSRHPEHAPSLSITRALEWEKRYVNLKQGKK